MTYIRPATVSDALYVANRLRFEDRREIEGLGHSPLTLVWVVETSTRSVAFYNTKGEISGLAGIYPDDNPRVGQIWMVCTPAIEKSPVTFVRQARKWLAEVGKDYDLLWNLMDFRNEMHHKLVKMLGFKLLRYVPVAPYNLPYIEIVKLCASSKEPLLQQP